MSYCRFSTDDFNCDVYVYADVDGGWTTHVACNRTVLDRAKLPAPVSPYTQFDAWAERHRVVSAMTEVAPLVPIGLPHDGETFNDPTPGACADRLEALRAVGYTVPQGAIDDLREEEEGADHV